MKKVKVYNFETRKKNYLVVGTSVKDVISYFEDNKYDLDLSFDMSGYYKVSLAKGDGMKVSSYTLYDKGLETEYIDEVNLQYGDNVEFVTNLAGYELYENHREMIV